MKYKAFTLAEVLITLCIIGVVAAMTIPSLITSYKAYRYRAQFLKSYSTLQQIIKQMAADDISLDGSSYAVQTFQNVIKPYLNNTTQCRTYKELESPLCLSRYKEKYNNLTNSAKMPWHLFDDGQFILADGSQLFIENPELNNIVILLIDLNGYITPPNRAGIDLFLFQLTDNGVVPMGSPNTKFARPYHCSTNTKEWANGTGCAVKAKDNPYYFKTVLKLK